MNPEQRKFAIAFLGILVGALAIGRALTEVPVAIPFVVAATALFRFGYSLQNHAVRSLRRLRVTPRTAIWFTAAVTFWYSTIVWIWWSRGTSNFPLILLNAELAPTLFFNWVPLLVIAGLILENFSAEAAK